jgi:hypothetical protein
MLSVELKEGVLVIEASPKLLGGFEGTDILERPLTPPALDRGILVNAVIWLT